MKHISDKDLEMLKREANKLGLEIVCRSDIPIGKESEYIDLSDINIFDKICIPYDYSELERYDVFDMSKILQAA